MDMTYLLYLDSQAPHRSVTLLARPLHGLCIKASLPLLEISQRLQRKHARQYSKFAFQNKACTRGNAAAWQIECQTDACWNTHCSQSSPVALQGSFCFCSRRCAPAVSLLEEGGPPDAYTPACGMPAQPVHSRLVLVLVLAGEHLLGIGCCGRCIPSWSCIVQLRLWAMTETKGANFCAAARVLMMLS